MPETEDDTLILEQDAWAIVWSPGHGWRLLIPEMLDSDEVPDEGFALTFWFEMLTGEMGEQFLGDTVTWGQLTMKLKDALTNIKGETVH